MKKLMILFFLFSPCIPISGCTEETVIAPRLPEPDRPRRKCPGPHCPHDAGNCPDHDEQGNLKSK